MCFKLSPILFFREAESTSPPISEKGSSVSSDSRAGSEEKISGPERVGNESANEETTSNQEVLSDRICTVSQPSSAMQAKIAVTPVLHTVSFFTDFMKTIVFTRWIFVVCVSWISSSHKSLRSVTVH